MWRWTPWGLGFFEATPPRACLRQADTIGGKEHGYFCIHFARGMCAKGVDCTYYHRVPTAEDDALIDRLHDVFGRERHSTHRDDMGGGVGHLCFLWHGFAFCGPVLPHSAPTPHQPLFCYPAPAPQQHHRLASYGRFVCACQLNATFAPPPLPVIPFCVVMGSPVGAVGSFASDSRTLYVGGLKGPRPHAARGTTPAHAREPPAQKGHIRHNNTRGAGRGLAQRKGVKRREDDL